MTDRKRNGRRQGVYERPCSQDRDDTAVVRPSVGRRKSKSIGNRSPPGAPKSVSCVALRVCAHDRLSNHSRLSTRSKTPRQQNRFTRWKRVKTYGKYYRTVYDDDPTNVFPVPVRLANEMRTSADLFPTTVFSSTVRSRFSDPLKV